MGFALGASPYVCMSLHGRFNLCAWACGTTLHSSSKLSGFSCSCPGIFMHSDSVYKACKRPLSFTTLRFGKYSNRVALWNYSLLYSENHLDAVFDGAQPLVTVNLLDCLPDSTLRANDYYQSLGPGQSCNKHMAVWITMLKFASVFCLIRCLSRRHLFPKKMKPFTESQRSAHQDMGA